MRNRLAWIEERLQSIIEGSAARIFPVRLAQNDLASRLVEAMRAGLQEDGSHSPVAPNLYTIVTHPERVHQLQADTGMLKELSQALAEAGQQAGFRFPAHPVIRVLGDTELGMDDVRVLAQNSRADLSQTSALEPVKAPAQKESVIRIPPGAFLIISGSKTVVLNQPVINIGRRGDNQIVLDDPRVSRVHAQLRVVKGRYVIFDLDSTGGTLVNGEPVKQATIKQGDVISLAGVPLVYGQDSDGPDETQEFDLDSVE